MLDRRSMLAAPAALLPVPARAQTTVPVRVGYVPVIGASALFVLDGAGWAREAGLDLRLVKFDSGPNAIQALASGTLDVLAIGVAPVAVARARGIDVSVIAAAAVGGSGFAAGPALAEAFAAAGGNVRRAFSAFRRSAGKPAKLGTLPAGGVPTVALHHWLWRVAEVDRADVEIAPLGIEVVQQAMLAGAIDGGTLLEPSLTIVTGRNPRIRMIVTARDMFPDVPGVVLAVTGAFSSAQPAAVDRFARLFLRATELVRDAPAEAAPHVRAVLGGGLVDVATITRALASPAVTFTTDLDRIRPATDRLLAYQVELGDFPRAPTSDTLFDGRVLARARAGR